MRRMMRWVAGGAVWGLVTFAWPVAVAPTDGGHSSVAALTAAGATSPGARSRHTAIYDSIGQRMVVFAGYVSASGAVQDEQAVNDVWALSLGGTPVWSQLIPLGTPPIARAGHVAIYDGANRQMVIFGGFSPSTLAELNDAWVLSLSGTPTWTRLAPTGPAPSPREMASAIYDPFGKRMVVFGGASGSLLEATNEVWVLSLIGTPTWTQLTPEGSLPLPQYDHAAVYDPVDQSMVVLGRTKPEAEALWSLALSGAPRWTQISAAGTRPSTNPALPAIYDPVGQRVLVPDGESHPGIYALSLGDAPAWQQIVAPGSGLPAHTEYSMIYDDQNRQAVTYGGYYIGQPGTVVVRIPIFPPPVSISQAVWVLTGLGSPGCAPSWLQLLPGAAPAPVSFTSTRTLYLPVVGNLCGG